MTILDINSLYLDIRQPILRGVSLQIREGEVHGLVGESGAGKTLVGKCVLGLLPDHAEVTHGFINFDGHDLLKIHSAERRELLGRDITLIPQNPMTTLDHVKRIEPQIVDVLQLHLGMKAAARSHANGVSRSAIVAESTSSHRRYFGAAAAGVWAREKSRRRPHASLGVAGCRSGLGQRGTMREDLIYSDFVAILRCFQKIPPYLFQYAAATFFVRALSRLELEINQSFPTQKE